MHTGREAGQGHGAGSPAEQVKALVDLLAGKGSQGSQILQPPDRTPESLLRPHGNGKQTDRDPWALFPSPTGGRALFLHPPPPSPIPPLWLLSRFEDTEAPRGPSEQDGRQP